MSEIIDQSISNLAGTPQDPVSSHRHNGYDSLQVNFTDLLNRFIVMFTRIGLGISPDNLAVMIANGLYFSQEYDNGSVSSTATIDWSKGNIQYVTLTGNTTFTFTNPRSGMRCILHVAGAYTPTFPGSVRWTGGTTPTATASAGHKDIYTLIYSGKESLYDVLQSPNYAIT